MEYFNVIMMCLQKRAFVPIIMGGGTGELNEKGLSFGGVQRASALEVSCSFLKDQPDPWRRYDTKSNLVTALSAVWVKSLSHVLRAEPC